ncbi:MAG TPA: amino acid racemase [Desulfobacterales bacterium]|nr:amino acid racemase [Desulfobacterales bacterium]
MKKIGLVGGVGPESTLDYYRLIIRAFQERKSADYPEILVYSANLTELLALMEARRWDELTGWLLRKIEALHRAGAEFAAIGSNSPHAVFEDVQRRSPLPLVSIVEAARDEAASRGSRRPGLLGTAFTMQADFYPETFRNRGMQMVVPPAEDQALIHRKLFTEIELGIFKDETRDQLLGVVERMIRRDGIDSLVLGCTELPLILTKDEFGIPFLNTTAVHVDAIVRAAL